MIVDEWMSVFEIETEEGYYDSVSVILTCEKRDCPAKGEITTVGWESLDAIVRYARNHHTRYHQEGSNG